MEVAKSINSSQYHHILTNVLDRLMDFYILLYSSMKINSDTLKQLIDFRDNTESYLISLGIHKKHLVDLNAVNECMDILQVNYSYCRKISQKSILANPDSYAAYQELSKVIYEISSGNHVEITNSGPIIHSGKPEEQTVVRNYMNTLKNKCPCLHLLRIADIVNAPKLGDIIPVIECAIQSYRKLNSVVNDILNDEEKMIVDTAVNHLKKLTVFYPERLYPGFSYVFPQYDGPRDYNNLALSFSHEISRVDMQGALSDIAFQFEKFKAYYHHHDSDITDEFNLDRFTPLVAKPIRDNEYIKQFNSIEGTFHALFAWKESYLGPLSQKDAIHKAHLLFNEPRELPIPAKDYKRKVRARLKDINDYINKKIEHMQSISQRG